jgi:hypothetical protein
MELNNEMMSETMRQLVTTSSTNYDFLLLQCYLQFIHMIVRHLLGGKECRIERWVQQIILS